MMKTLPEKFWERTKAIGRHCIEWIGFIRFDGYGEFRVHGKKCTAHRIVWEITFGPIPEGMNVLHRCDNRWCVNPDHLFLGTHADNVADKVCKGRHVWGEKHKLAKLNEARVQEIRSIVDSSLTEIAKRFGISKQTVWDVRSGRSWKHVT